MRDPDAEPDTLAALVEAGYASVRTIEDSPTHDHPCVVRADPAGVDGERIVEATLKHDFDGSRASALPGLFRLRGPDRTLAAAVRRAHRGAARHAAGGNPVPKPSLILGELLGGSGRSVELTAEVRCGSGLD